jgi:TPR repeat protein
MFGLFKSKKRAAEAEAAAAPVETVAPKPQLTLEKLTQGGGAFAVDRAALSRGFTIEHRTPLPEAGLLPERRAYTGTDRISRSRGRSYRYLGLAFLRGENVARDALRAQRLLDLGAQAGDTASLFHLARCAQFGWGRPAHSGEAMALFARVGRMCRPDMGTEPAADAPVTETATVAATVRAVAGPRPETVTEYEPRLAGPEAETADDAAPRAGEDEAPSTGSPDRRLDRSATSGG